MEGWLYNSLDKRWYCLNKAVAEVAVGSRDRFQGDSKGVLDYSVQLYIGIKKEKRVSDHC